MIRIALAVAAIGLGAMVPMGAPALASGQTSVEDQLKQLLDKATEVYNGKGFTATGWTHQSSLKQGASEQVSVTLTGGAQYQVVGVCDTDCSNIDIHLYDSSGNEVDKDVETDDFPIVGAAKDGTYTVQLSMVTCSTEPCSYALKAFRK
jgi:hypothetical protein